MSDKAYSPTGFCQIRHKGMNGIETMGTVIMGAYAQKGVKIHLLKIPPRGGTPMPCL